MFVIPRFAAVKQAGAKPRI